MTRTGIIAVVATLAIVVAALVGWRGSRPASPVAAVGDAKVHNKGVTVVPATETLRREDATVQSPPAPATAPSPAAIVAIPRLDPDLVDTLPARFAAEPRDPAWAPDAEASARTAVADVPHLAGPMQARCAATLCRMTGMFADGRSRDAINDGMQALQSRSMDRMVRGGPFRDGSMTFMPDPDGHLTVTVWLVRR